MSFLLSVGCHEFRSESRNQSENPGCTGDDGDQLVHIPRGVPVPHDRHQGIGCGSRHSDWVLRLRHHLKVWRWIGYLSDLIREIKEGGPPTVVSCSQRSDRINSSCKSE